MTELVSGGIALCGLTIGSLTGGALAAAFVLKRYGKGQPAEPDRGEQRRLARLLTGLRTELETVWDLYLTLAGSRLEALEENKPFQPYVNLPFTFSLYDGNAVMIGAIADDDLRSRVIAAFTSFKGLLESFRHNNEIMLRLEQHAAAYDEGDEQSSLGHKIRYRGYSVSHAKNMRLLHYRVAELVEDLTPRLTEEAERLAAIAMEPIMLDEVVG